jgi:prevent-host-death family protein
VQVSLSEAKARLTELVRRAEAGEEVVLTKHGRPAVSLVPTVRKLAPGELRARRIAAIGRAIREARERRSDGGPSAARSADYLYGDDGLPA